MATAKSYGIYLPFAGHTIATKPTFPAKVIELGGSDGASGGFTLLSPGAISLRYLMRASVLLSCQRLLHGFHQTDC
jgi:hypothetical protein